MAKYTTSYRIRYQLPTLQEQIEVATVIAAQDILNEDASTPDHENRVKWAAWANEHSNAAWVSFAWAVAMNPSIQASVETDPTGQSVPDADVQFVVNSNLDKVIRDFVVNPPPDVGTAPAMMAARAAPFQSLPPQQ